MLRDEPPPSRQSSAPVKRVGVKRFHRSAGTVEIAFLPATRKSQKLLVHTSRKACLMPTTATGSPAGDAQAPAVNLVGWWSGALLRGHTGKKAARITPTSSASGGAIRCDRISNTLPADEEANWLSRHRGAVNVGAWLASDLTVGWVEQHRADNSMP